MAGRRSNTERRNTRSPMECPRKHKTNTQHKWLQLLGIIIFLHGQKFLGCTQACTGTHICTHKWTFQGMLTATAPYAPSMLRGNLRNGTVRNFRYLKQSFTFLLVKEFKLWLFCESTEHLRIIHQPTLSVYYPELMFRLNKKQGDMCLFYMCRNTADCRLTLKLAAFNEILSSYLQLHSLSVFLCLFLISPLLDVSSGTLFPCLCASTNTRGRTSNCINRWPESIKHTQIKCWTHLLYVESN